jgi:tetratricopeptide (TPR) repeat protein
LQQALRHHRAQRLQEASAAYHRVLAIDPRQPAALQNLGLIAIERGRFAFAVELIGKAIARNPDDAGAHYNLGLALHKTKRLEEAAAAYQRAGALRPDFAEAHYNAGNVLNELGNADKAIACYRQVVAARPDFAEAHANLATALAETGRAEEAAAEYRAALNLAPNLAELHNNLGTALSDLGCLEEAAASYRRALALDPANADAWFHLHATLYDDSGERAADCLEAALKVDPQHALSRFFLGVLREHQGHTKAAAAHFAALPMDCEFAACGRDSWNYIKSARGAECRLFGETAEGLTLALSAAGIDGLVLEFGVRWGTTIRQIAARAGQEVHGFDTFTGLPEDWHEFSVSTYSTEGQLPPVPANVHLHQGLFADTLPVFLETHPGPVRFANIDCDLCSATKTVLALLGPRIVPGTILVFDEYLFTPHWREDEYRAFQEAVRDHGWRYEYLAFSLLSKQAVVRIIRSVDGRIASGRDGYPNGCPSPCASAG